MTMGLYIMNALAFFDSVTGYAAEVIIVYLFIKKIFNVKGSKLYFGISAVFLLIILCLFFLLPETASQTAAFFSLAGMMIPPLLLKGPPKFYIINIIFTMNFMVFFFSLLLVLVFSFFISPVIGTVYYDYIGIITATIVTGVFWILSTVWKTKTQFFIESVSKPVYVMFNAFLFVGGVFNFLAAATDATADRKIIFLKFFALFVSLIFSIAFPVLIYNQVKKNLYMSENRLFEQQLNTQLEYCKTITESSYELRKFRHDYNNLSVWIKPLLKAGRTDEALGLVEKCDNEIIDSFKILYSTGNDIADAILTDKQRKAGEKIKITFAGNLNNLPPDNIDICILLNNTIDIALEETENRIDIYADCTHGVMLYQIRFTSKDFGREVKAGGKSHKQLPLNILQKFADKNDGELDISFNNGLATIDVKYIF